MYILILESFKPCFIIIECLHTVSFCPFLWKNKKSILWTNGVDRGGNLQSRSDSKNDSWSTFFSPINYSVVQIHIYKLYILTKIAVSLLFVYSWNPVCVIGFRFNSIMINMINSISRCVTFSAFNITAHGYIFIYIFNQTNFVWNVLYFFYYKQATF